MGNSGVGGISRDGKTAPVQRRDEVGRRTASISAAPTGRCRRFSWRKEAFGLGLSPDSKWAIVVREGPDVRARARPHRTRREEELLKVAGIDTSRQRTRRSFRTGSESSSRRRAAGSPAPMLRPGSSTEARRGRSLPRASTLRSSPPMASWSPPWMPRAESSSIRWTEGAPKAASGPAETGELKAWSEDGRSLYVSERVGDGRIKVFRSRPGERTAGPLEGARCPPILPESRPWMADRSDGAYAYGYNRTVGNLYLVEGLK